MRVRGIDFVGITFGPDTNLKEVAKFYRETLGISAGYTAGGGESDSWTEFDTHPVALALMKWQDSGKSVIALAVDEVQAAVDELRGKGVKILYGPHEFDPCVMAAIEDPWGNQLILHARKDGTVG